MSYLGRAFSTNFKYLKPNLLNNRNFYSVLSSVNLKSGWILRDEHERKVFERKHCRHFSLKELGEGYINFFDKLASSEAVKFFRDEIIYIHDYTGLPWWSTIILTAVTVKLCISLPAGLYQQYLVAKLNLTKVEMDKIAKQLKEEVILEARKGKWTNEKANLHMRRKMRDQWKELLVKNNCHPAKIIILTYLQLPTWLLFSLTLRRLAMEVSTGMFSSPFAALQFKLGGVFWSPDLTMPDQTLIIPFLTFACGLMIVETDATMGVSKFLMSKIAINLLRIFVFVSLIISLYTPSCLSLFWVTSVSMSLAQKFLLMSPKVRRLCGIPKTSKELEHPYFFLAQKFGERIGNLLTALKKLKN